MKSLFIEPLLTEDDALALATLSDIDEAQSLRRGPRRCEFLTWRAIVRRELGRDVRIGYNFFGAPVVGVQGIHIGVSHCRGRVAVCISDAPCAVDIEPADRDFNRVVFHYLTPGEQALCDDPLWYAVAWCAKETLYKLSDRIELDLRRDLRIESADLAAGRLTGRIENGEPVGLSVSCDDGYVVVYIL